MAHALVPAAESTVLKQNPQLTAALSDYRYQLQVQDKGVLLSVTDPTQTASVFLQWAFGVGNVGQTFVFLSSGDFYEARVSYYKSLNGLALTTGHAGLPVNSLKDAVGRKLSPGEVARCFGCHTTMEADSMIPGIQCAACHQDLSKHLASFAAKASQPSIPDRLSALSSSAMADRCGACHRVAADIRKFGPHSLDNLRFQPYRLEASRCFIATDQRISCVACHNPHQQLQTKPESYDAQCKACHQTRSNIASIKLCRVATKDCVTCHMPQVEYPEMHHKFTDHRIQIVRAGQPYVD